MTLKEKPMYANVGALTTRRVVMGAGVGVGVPVGVGVGVAGTGTIANARVAPL